MLPEKNYQESARGVAWEIYTDSLTRGAFIDTPTMKTYESLIDGGQTPLFILSHDTKILRAIDLFDVDFALETVIPMISHSLRRGDVNTILSIPDIDRSKRKTVSPERIARASQLREASRLMSRKSVDFVFQKYGYSYHVGGGDSTLSVRDMPHDLRFLKMFNPQLIIEAQTKQSVFMDLRAKCEYLPFVTSLYANGDSMTLFGVGLRAAAQHIIRSFVTDVASGSTTVSFSPASEDSDHNLQFTDWEAARAFCDVGAACMINNREAWYPEFHIIPDTFESVVVRRYDAFVTYSSLMRNGFNDGNRAVAALVLSDLLNGLPVEVLE